MAPLIRLAAPLLLIAAPALAEAPRVVADIAPVQALVARVMAGAGAPEVPVPEVLAIVPAGASPHGFSLRPSQAAAIEAAEIVVTIGAGLTPWLDGPLGTLAPEAARLTLTEVAGVTLHEAREAVLLGGDAGHEGHGAEGHGHAEPEGKHDHDHDHDGHDHGPVDPHAWLDPLNAAPWVTRMRGPPSALPSWSR